MRVTGLPDRHAGHSGPEKHPWRLARSREPRTSVAGFSRAEEKAHLIFRRSCINQKFEIYNKVVDLILEPHGLRLRPAEVVIHDQFRALHREPELAGHLDHALPEEEVNAMRDVRVLRSWRAGS